MSEYDYEKIKNSSVVEEVALTRPDTSFSNSFSTTFSNPFTTYPIKTADINSDTYTSRYYLPEPHPQWPKEPLALEPTRSESFVLMLYDTVAFLVPVLLTVKGALVIVAWHMDKKLFRNQVDQTSQLTLTLIRINQQMVTAFTMVFTAIISTLLRRYALYQAQQGASIGKLEQFHGSTSLLATVRMIWGLHSFSKTSIILLLVWSLYYLGSQASGLEYRLTDSAPFRTMVAAIPTDAVPSVFGWPEPSTFSPLFTTMAAWNNIVIQRASASFWYYVPEYSPGTDIFRNVIVPDLRFLTSSQLASTNTGPILEPDEHGWYDVSKHSWIFDRSGYSGIAGWPVAVFNGTGNKFESRLIDRLPRYLGDYTFSPTYFSADCSELDIHIGGGFPNYTSPDQTVGMNMTDIDTEAPTDSQGNHLRSLELWAALPISSTSLYATAVCNISQTTVDVQVHCQTTGCFPRSMRWANGSAESAVSFGTIFDDPTFATAFLGYASRDLSEAMTLVIPQFDHNTSWPGPVSSIFNSLPDGPRMQVSLSRAMTMAMNTFYLMSLRWNYAEYTMDELINHSADFNMTTVPFKGALYNPHYTIYWEWLAIDLICCLVLLMAAIASIRLRMRTTAPDILGWVSSLTRADSTYRFPTNGTSLSGIKRARLMKQIKVKLGDTSSGNDGVGRIGLVRLDVGDREVKALSKTTKYV